MMVHSTVPLHSHHAAMTVRVFDTTFAVSLMLLLTAGLLRSPDEVVSTGSSKISIAAAVTI